MKKGFWTIVDEMAPAFPAAGGVTWTATREAILEVLRSHGLEPGWEFAEDLLLNNDKYNPGFAWNVERKDGGLRFTPKP